MLCLNYSTMFKLSNSCMHAHTFILKPMLLCNLYILKTSKIELVAIHNQYCIVLRVSCTCKLRYLQRWLVLDYLFFLSTAACTGSPQPFLPNGWKVWILKACTCIQPLFPCSPEKRYSWIYICEIWPALLKLHVYILL